MISGQSENRSWESYYISVVVNEFKVSKTINDWLSPGADVTVTFWPRSKVVARVYRPRMFGRSIDPGV